MNRNRRRINAEQNQKLILTMVIDFLCIPITLFALRHLHDVSWDTHYLVMYLLATIVFTFFSEVFELYRPWRTGSFSKLLAYASLSWIIAAFSVVLYLFFFKVSESVSRLVIGFWFLCVLAELLIWRVIFSFYLKRRRIKGFDTQKVVILGMTNSGIELARQIRLNPQTGLELLGFFDDRAVSRLPVSDENKYLGDVDKALMLAKFGYCDAIYIALPLSAEQRMNNILQTFANTTLKVHLVTDFFTYNLLNARLSHVGESQTVSVYESPLSGFLTLVKRLEDLIIGTLILTLISIPMVIIGLLIKLDSKGPVLFKQKRYGLDEKPIKVWKFRSMTVEDNGAVVKQATKGDARITKLGAFLRRTSLDELPQFINVIMGDMSIVGPRPHAVVHNEEYRALIGFYMLRNKVKPGITGWAQINGWRGETDTLDKMEKRVEYDLVYIRNWSLFFDIKIIFLTIFKGFVNKNAY